MEGSATKIGRVCAKCGATIYADSPGGLCGVCLFQTALGPLDDDDEIPNQSRKIQMEFGDYEILEEIGRGGQGVVYRARQKSLNRTVALKVIGLGQWASTSHLKRFRHEAEAAASLEHSQIVPIYEIGERDGSCYFSMKFIEGGQLDEFVRREPLSPRRAAELLVKMARTVQFAHEHGILHRDIKPGNILLDRDGEPHLTDFGLARLVEQESTVTNSFDVLGTPSYMSPEQASGRAKELSAAADVYSLGAVLYHLLTGQPPFAGGTTYETIRQVMETEPRNPRLWNPRVDVDLATICLKCLEKESQKRYETAEALAEDLERWLRLEPIHARPVGIFTRGRKWLRRNPATAMAVASLIAAVAVIVWKSGLIHPAATSGIAVLPFENLSEDKSSGYFADGIQDEILTRLSKISALRVISRTSTQQYVAKPRNLSDIARELGVANVLEGSVQKVADQVHVNVQLIRAATDEHLWAESYDRKLENIFGVETDVATQVAAALKAKLNGAEEKAISSQPTNNPQAYDAYLRGLAYALRPHLGSSDTDILDSITHFTEAVKLDPNFAVAWASLARATSIGYFNLVGDDVPALRETAKRAVAKVVQLRPDLEEAPLAEGYFHYYCEQDYEAAITCFKRANELAPRASEPLDALALVSRRTRESDRSLQYFQQAIQIDPRNITLLSDYADTLCEQRRYPSALKVYDQVLEMSPNNTDALVSKATIYQSEANLPEAAKILARLPIDPTAELWFPAQVWQRIFERRFSEAIALLQDALARSDRDGLKWTNADYRIILGDLQTWTGDSAAARANWEQVRTDLENMPRLKKIGPVYSDYEVWLAETYASLGESSKAQAVLSTIHAHDGDPLEAARLAGSRARVAIRMRDVDRVIEQLEIASRSPAGPGGIDYGDLKLSPLWDSLRGDPRFEKIVSSLEPKE